MSLVYLPPAPSGTHWFEVDGIKIFPVYAPDGGISTKAVAWLVKYSGDKMFASGVILYLGDDPLSIAGRIDMAMGKFEIVIGGHLHLPKG